MVPCSGPFKLLTFPPCSTPTYLWRRQLGFQWTLRSEAFTKSLAKISNGEKPSRARLQELAKANLEKMADKRQSKEKDDLAWNSYL